MTLDSIQQSIEQAAAKRTALRLRGGGTKDFYGNEPRGEVLDTRAYAGIVDYEPTELVVTARCGTRLSDLEAELATAGQCLPFEPPHFGAAATLGGCVAAGLSGPRRAAAGALRDYVLGAKIVDGRGRVLAFGGQVMKNVAGYDVSRLLAGSLGTLGFIAEVSIKVLPRAAAERTLRLEMPQAAAIEALNGWAGKPLPLSASTWHDGVLSLRLEGRPAALEAAAAQIGGEAVDGAVSEPFWRALREQSHPFFAGAVPLWRLAVPTLTAPLELRGGQLLEWGAGLRWLKSDAAPEDVREAAHRAGGHATLFRSVKKPVDAFAPLSPVALRIHREVKAAFDPAGILNPGRLVPEQ